MIDEERVELTVWSDGRWCPKGLELGAGSVRAAHSGRLPEGSVLLVMKEGPTCYLVQEDLLEMANTFELNNGG